MHNSYDQNKVILDSVENSIGKHVNNITTNGFVKGTPTTWRFQNPFYAVFD